MFSEKTEKLLPFAGRAGDNLLEQKPTGRIQDDGRICEPPVHVDGAANALELVLHPRRKSDLATSDGLRLTGGRFSNDCIPG